MAENISFVNRTPLMKLLDKLASAFANPYTLLTHDQIGAIRIEGIPSVLKQAIPHLLLALLDCIGSLEGLARRPAIHR